MGYIYTGWWYTYPSEKMKVSWDDDIPNIWKNNVPNHQPVYIYIEKKYHRKNDIMALSDFNIQECPLNIFHQQPVSGLQLDMFSY